MSYSFYWDCAVPLSNIRDIVNINIVPVTSVVEEKENIIIKGYVSVDGEYISLTNEQYLFQERLPIDITLPSDGCRGEIVTDVSNFDYQIRSSNQLHLNLNLTVHGYVVTDEELDVKDESQDEQLVNHVFDETNRLDKQVNATLSATDQFKSEEIVVEKPVEVIKEVIVEKPIEVIKEVIVEKPVEVVKEVIVEKPVEVVKEVIVEKPIVTEVVKEIVVEKESKPPIQYITVDGPKFEADIKPTVEEVTVENVNVEQVSIENVFPFVEKPTIYTDHSMQDKSKIFDMLYDFNNETEPEEEVTPEPVVVPVTPVTEGVFSHFADGESKVKIVFIQEEEVTVEQLCEKHNVSKSNINGLNNTQSDVFYCNDRVMIRYDQ